MKRIITLFTLLIVCTSALHAQNAFREKGTFAIDAGLGLSFGFNGSTTTFPPVFLSGEYTFLDFGSSSLSVGVTSGLQVRKSKYYDYYDVSVYYGVLAPFAAYHLCLVDNLDLFAKVGIGYNLIGSSNREYNEYISEGTLGTLVYLGASWFFTEHLGVGAELGYGGITNLGIKVTFKF